MNKQLPEDIMSKIKQEASDYALAKATDRFVCTETNIRKNASDDYIAGRTASVQPTIQLVKELIKDIYRYCPDAKDRYNLVVSIERVEAALSSLPSNQQPIEGKGLQKRVNDWMIACFGEEIPNDVVERYHRFFEEVTELVQALGCTKSECYQLVDYVFNRPKGITQQEIGGVMLTLAALCNAAGTSGFDMFLEAEKELERVWTKIGMIREKQANKPKHSPLPEPPKQ